MAVTDSTDVNVHELRVQLKTVRFGMTERISTHHPAPGPLSQARGRVRFNLPFPETNDLPRSVIESIEFRSDTRAISETRLRPKSQFRICTGIANASTTVS
jgi:hypothetical protein